MKPTKNLVFCAACKRLKMLFDTQAKADNFIRFNQKEIKKETGRAPVRSYYCSICCGYHVTSKPLNKISSSMDYHYNIVANHLDQSIEEQNSVSKRVNALLVEVDRDKNQNYESAFSKLEECRLLMKSYKKSPYVSETKSDLIRKIKKREDKLDTLLKNELAKLQMLPSQQEKQEKAANGKLIIRDKDTQRLAMLYLIDRFEELQWYYDNEDYAECSDIMGIIARGLDELQKNDDTQTLSYQYEQWQKKL